MDNIHLSPSQAKKCLAAVGFEKVLGIRQPQNEAMAIGSDFHSCVENFYRGRPIDAKTVMGRKLFDAYAESDIHHDITPNLIEHEVIREFHGVPVINHVDLGYMAGDRQIIGDYETKSERSAEMNGTRMNEDELLQLAAYVWAMDLPIPSKVEIHNIVKSNPPAVYPTEHWVDQDDIDKVLERYDKLVAAYKTLQFAPEPSWKCNNCFYWDRCKAGEIFDGNFNALVPPDGRAKQEVSIMSDPSTNGARSPKKYVKLALIGDHGTRKTRTALAFPNVRVIDTEHGTDHYLEEFGIKPENVLQITNVHEIDQKIMEMASNPNGADTLVMDSFTLYCDAVTSYFISLFLKKETSSKGNKGDYYTLQPRDYQPINEYLNKRMRLLISLHCNVILTCHVKDEYDSLQKTGNKLPDGFKKMVYYMDTVIYLTKAINDKNQWVVRGEVEKDRTNCLPARIMEFSFDFLKECWGKYLDHHAEAAPEVAKATEPEPVPAPVANQESVPEPVPTSKPAVSEATVAKIRDKFAKIGASAAVADDWIAEFVKRMDGTVAQGYIIKEAGKIDAQKIWQMALEDIRIRMDITDEQWVPICTKYGGKSSDTLMPAVRLELLGRLEERLEDADFQDHLARWPFRSPAGQPANA